MINRRSLLIGIDGLGGSGKTTYAYALQRQIKNCIILHLDDFIYPKKVRYNEDYEEWECYYRLQWRYDELIETLLMPLNKGQSVHEAIEIYNKETDSYTMREMKIPAGTIVIVEGVFLQRPELSPFFDCVIYLDVEKELRLQRVLHRDTYIGDKEEILWKYENRYFPAEDVYLEQCQPLARADAVEVVAPKQVNK